MIAKLLIGYATAIGVAFVGLNLLKLAADMHSEAGWPGVAVAFAIVSALPAGLLGLYLKHR